MSGFEMVRVVYESTGVLPESVTQSDVPIQLYHLVNSALQRLKVTPELDGLVTGAFDSSPERRHFPPDSSYMVFVAISYAVVYSGATNHSEILTTSEQRRDAAELWEEKGLVDMTKDIGIPMVDRLMESNPLPLHKDDSEKTSIEEMVKMLPDDVAIHLARRAVIRETDYFINAIELDPNYTESEYEDDIWDLYMFLVEDDTAPEDLLYWLHYIRKCNDNNVFSIPLTHIFSD